MSTRHHPFSTKLPRLSTQNSTVHISVHNMKGGSGKTYTLGDSSFQDEMEFRSGKPQRNAVAFIGTLIEAGRPLPEMKEYFMQTLDYRVDNPDDILRFESLLVDRFAMALSFEHEDVSRILEFLADNEAEIFPEGLESYEFHKKVDTFYEKAQRGGNIKPLDVTSNPDGSQRDLLALDKYLRVMWDEYIPFFISDGKLDVIAQIAHLKLMDIDELTYQILPFSGEKASSLRIAIHGSDVVTTFEADERLSQVMVGAFPPLEQKIHLIGSADHLKFLVNDIHLPELAKASEFLSSWAIHGIGQKIALAKGLEREWVSNKNEKAQTRLVFSFFRDHIPNLHRYLGNVLCDKPIGVVAGNQYTEQAFAGDLLKEIAKRCKKNADGSYQPGNGTGHFHYYLSILETVDSKSFDELPEQLSPHELLLAYQLTRHKPLLKHLNAEHRDLAFNGDLGL
ncbi:hypothetical protein [Pseudomonas amygdali]|nr:hypothetical protein [Pseudomonas amygdali]